MEPDDLKLAWQTLSRRLERHDALQTHVLLEQRKQKALNSLRPLFWGQVVQTLFGIPFILLASLLWIHGGQSADGLPWTTIVAGIVVQLYGIATIAMAGQTLLRIREIDYAQPIVDIQKRLATLRRTYLVNGMLAGLPWWFLWVPLLMVLAGLGGTNLYARAPSVVWIGLGVGAAGLAATAWFHRWSRDPARPRLAKAMEDSVTGGSLRRAQAQIDEVARFETE
ncbi:serine/threonine protein kinase [Pseudoxanthomonas sp. PXM01]|uniref:serine/threonine protein kinase n=1 Tax=Pseudoxanthomonas sp. PXM01 TaxID=2769295 RepID=UPI00177A91C0|nr:serine/threonine protein kinase [Pseudoxanthomonas sp. PXM01]MBD9469574.1 serine/threonine protein kinase [Pseudoxanthomonas sp. PXM01]